MGSQRSCGQRRLRSACADPHSLISIRYTHILYIFVRFVCCSPRILVRTSMNLIRIGILVFACEIYVIWAASHDKTNKMTVRTAKTQISLGIRPVWSESSPCAQWVAKDQSFLHAGSEDSDHTGRMLRLIRVFTGRTSHFVGFVMRWLIWTTVLSMIFCIWFFVDSVKMRRTL